MQASLISPVGAQRAAVPLAGRAARVVQLPRRVRAPQSASPHWRSPPAAWHAPRAAAGDGAANTCSSSGRSLSLPGASLRDAWRGAADAAEAGICGAGYAERLQRVLSQPRRPRVGASSYAASDDPWAEHEQQQRQQQHPGAAQRQGRGRRWPAAAYVALTWQVLVWVALPSAALASETLSAGLLDVFRQFLEQIQALGPWGAVLFVTTVALAEMVPLFPTQPLSLASGLLFGAKQGALLMLVGVTLAGLGAFTVARGVGRPLAERIIKAEMGHEGDGSGGGGMGSTWASVEAAIESGGFFKQLTAVTLLRLTPVVPYSATNYLLGLTPVQLPAFLLGTVAGMSVWAVLYASLGGASRTLLDGGADLELLLVDLGEKASSYSQDIALLGAGVIGVGAVAFLLSRRSGGSGGGAAQEAGAGAAVGQQHAAQPGQGQGQQQKQQDVLRQEEVLNHK